MIANHSLSFVIPAKLNTINDEKVLHRTIEKILNIFSEIIVISQGLKPHFSNKNIKNYHSNNSLGKWCAVSYANRFKLNNFIFIHDCDNPFKEESYKEILKFNRNTFIQRNEIILSAKDELSRESRKYIELFLNKYNNQTTCKGLDIQSGAIILKKDIFQKLNLRSFGDYGGELAIYKYLIQHNFVIDFINMEVEVDESREKSNYTIEKILNSVIRDPLTTIRVSEILQLCIDDYEKYIDSNHKFKTEVIYFLKKYNLIF